MPVVVSTFDEAPAVEVAISAVATLVVVTALVPSTVVLAIDSELCSVVPAFVVVASVDLLDETPPDVVVSVASDETIDDGIVIEVDVFSGLAVVDAVLVVTWAVAVADVAASAGVVVGVCVATAVEEGLTVVITASLVDFKLLVVASGIEDDSVEVDDDWDVTTDSVYAVVSRPDVSFPVVDVVPVVDTVVVDNVDNDVRVAPFGVVVLRLCVDDIGVGFVVVEGFGVVSVVVDFCVLVLVVVGSGVVVLVC